jgi:pyrroloquinoline quinone (PQQ) biosynthesis protein C
MRDTIQRLKARLDLPNHPYFVALEDETFTREDFVETQIQFLFAVVFFSRPMAVLAARLPRAEMRLSVLENVNEEHGEGNLSLSHERTFLELLARLGVTLEQIEQRAMWPEVRAFNTTLTGVCMVDDVWTGVAALGIIEDLFSGISARIGAAILKRGWLTPNQIIHYATHEILDITHADEFYQIIEPQWSKNPRHAYQIEQGLELGAHIFLQMYQGLYTNRQRRWERAVRGPHSLAEGWYLPES